MMLSGLLLLLLCADAWYSATTATPPTLTQRSRPSAPFNQRCHRQLCYGLPGQRCKQSGNVNVCVQDPAPTCAATSCLTGKKCVLFGDCAGGRKPCFVWPECVDKSPCGLCIPPGEFCEQSAKGPSVCRLVVEPDCKNLPCPPGQVCELQVVNCFRAPCPPIPTCVSKKVLRG